MRRQRIAAIVGLGAAYVLLSSWFGLTLTPTLEEGSMEGSLSFFVEVWSDSLLADAVFVGATLAAGAAALWLFDRLGWTASVVTGAVGNWVAYVASYSLLVEMRHPDVAGLGEAAVFVAEWGWPGLLLAAAVPAIGAWWLARRRVEMLFSGDAPA